LTFYLTVVLKFLALPWLGCVTGFDASISANRHEATHWVGWWRLARYGARSTVVPINNDFSPSHTQIHPDSQPCTGFLHRRSETTAGCPATESPAGTMLSQPSPGHSILLAAFIPIHLLVHVTEGYEPDQLLAAPSLSGEHRRLSGLIRPHESIHSSPTIWVMLLRSSPMSRIAVRESASRILTCGARGTEIPRSFRAERVQATSIEHPAASKHIVARQHCRYLLPHKTLSTRGRISERVGERLRRKRLVDAPHGALPI